MILTGTGVEAVETLGATFDHVVTAQVLAKEPHPDSDHLWVCSVDVGGHNLGEDGAPEPVTIVCGAQNFEAGDHIVTALPGAELPGGVKIKKSKLRGVASCGMNCSARELGLSSDHSGIMILPADAPVGMAFSEYAQLTDTVLDLEITPNRPDCLSMVGMAREVGAMYRIPYKNPLASMAEKMEPVREGRAIDSTVSITIPDPDRCPRYTARIIRGVKIGPSPDWLVERLASIGQRSINNVVDVTNYILFLFGQPLHSFDLGKVRNAHGYANIVVRAAEEGEVLETLDGVERQLTPDMTVIATPDAGAIALAGVMGGAATEVTDETTESSWRPPPSVLAAPAAPAVTWGCSAKARCATSAEWTITASMRAPLPPVPLSLRLPVARWCTPSPTTRGSWMRGPRKPSPSACSSACRDSAK